MLQYQTIWEIFFRLRAKLRWKKTSIAVSCKWMDWNTHNVSGDSEAMLSFFACSKFSVRDYNTSDVPTGQAFTINWSKIQLSWVLMLYYLYKMMFSIYKSVIVTPCACDLFVSKVTKITRYMDVCFWRSFFAVFFQCVMTVSWNLPQPGCWNYLYYIFSHSCTYTTQHFK